MSVRNPGRTTLYSGSALKRFDMARIYLGVVMAAKNTTLLFSADEPLAVTRYNNYLRRGLHVLMKKPV